MGSRVSLASLEDPKAASGMAAQHTRKAKYERRGTSGLGARGAAPHQPYHHHRKKEREKKEPKGTMFEDDEIQARTQLLLPLRPARTSRIR
jgi:hypothetical protein